MASRVVPDHKWRAVSSPTTEPAPRSIDLHCPKGQVNRCSARHWSAHYTRTGPTQRVACSRTSRHRFVARVAGVPGHDHAWVCADGLRASQSGLDRPLGDDQSSGIPPRRSPNQVRFGAAVANSQTKKGGKSNFFRPIHPGDVAVSCFTPSTNPDSSLRPPLFPQKIFFLFAQKCCKRPNPW